MKKACEKCIHKKVCIDGANYKNADKCEKFADEELILRLPCKLGDTAYKLERRGATKYRITDTTIVSIRISKSETVFIEASADVFFEENLNETVFFKREDAEKALKELKGEEISDPKLKPCPFCGGKAKSVNEGVYAAVRCSRCGATIAAVQTSGKYVECSEVAEAWNSRSEGRDTI